MQFNFLKTFFEQNGIKIHSCLRTLYIKDKLEYSGKAKKPFNNAVKKAKEAIQGQHDVAENTGFDPQAYLKRSMKRKQ